MKLPIPSSVPSTNAGFMSENPERSSAVRTLVFLCGSKNSSLHPTNARDVSKIE
jgi:hypothetical protein